MSQNNTPNRGYTITEHDYNILQGKLDDIQNMAIRHVSHATIANEILDISAQLRNIIIHQKKK